jgi:hypothetical protein
MSCTFDFWTRACSFVVGVVLNRQVVAGLYKCCGCRCNHSRVFHRQFFSLSCRCPFNESISVIQACSSNIELLIAVSFTPMYPAACAQRSYPVACHTAQADAAAAYLAAAPLSDYPSVLSASSSPACPPTQQRPRSSHRPCLPLHCRHLQCSSWPVSGSARLGAGSRRDMPRTPPSRKAVLDESLEGGIRQGCPRCRMMWMRGGRSSSVGAERVLLQKVSWVSLHVVSEVLVA